jgi:hypothetical protein
MQELRPWSDSCLAMKMCQRRPTAMSSPLRLSTSVGTWYPLTGISGDQAPLRAVEVFLLCLPVEEKEEEGGPVGANGVHEHPSLEPSGGRVHGHHLVEVRQGVAQALVLSKE